MKGRASDRPDDLLTPVHIEREIMRLSNLMDEGTEEYRGLAQDAAELEQDYKVKYAKARIDRRTQEGYGPGGRVTADEAEDHAIVACHGELLQYLVAQAIAEACREKQRSIRSQLDALRSLNANVRGMT